MRLSVLAVAAACVAVLSPAHAHQIRAGDLVIVHPMVKEAVEGQVSAQWSVEICNEGDSPDQLLSVSSEFARQVKVDPTTIPAKGRAKVVIVFQHIGNKLSEDEAYSGELTFKRLGKVRVDVMVHSRTH